MLKFTNLHTHSEFSLLSGTSSIEKLVEKASKLNCKALALTDVNKMSGLIVFYKLCHKFNIKPILGVELTDPKDSDKKLVLLAKNKEGYSNICEIITKRHLNEKDFQFSNIFKEKYTNLFIISNRIEVLNILRKTPNKENLYGELINSSIHTRKSSYILETFCNKHSIPLMISNDIYFLEKEEWQIHKILRAIAEGTTLSRLNKNSYANSNSYFRSNKEIIELFPRHKKALYNTNKIAEQCNVKLELGKWIMPKLELPPPYTPHEYLTKLTYKGLNRNYFGTKEFSRAKEIQDMELRVIKKLGYSSYFLMVKNIKDWAEKRFSKGFRHAGECSLMRGSAANSITFFNIGASNLDPIKYNLYFERFLNEERAKPPDADLDFAWDERDTVLNHIIEEWGADRTALICTTNHLNKRSAFRETAKVFGYSEAQITELIDESKFSNFENKDSNLSKVIFYAKKIEGRAHFLGQHPGGIIMTNEPINKYLACEFSGGTKNRKITQIDMHNGTDDLGLIKFDILGNGSLAVLRDALLQIEEQEYKNPELWKDSTSLNDKKVCEMISNGRTRGIFYIESPAQIKLNKKTEAASFEEIGITSSAIRPAGQESTSKFVTRHRKIKQGIKDWDFLHSSLEEILKETHDCLIYQEDVIKICINIAGMSFKKADKIRKMMNSLKEGRPEHYDNIASEFMLGCINNKGFTAEQAMELWSRVCSFSGFSFCKSHSLSYARLSFRCAWLKLYYPAQFMASVISNNHGFYQKEIYLNEARRFGVKILSISINKSQIKYIGNKNYIRPGFMHIKGLSNKTMNKIIKERNINGNYTSLENFIIRSKATTNETTLLIKTSCFAEINTSQAELISILDSIKIVEDNSSLNLFDASETFVTNKTNILRNYSLTKLCLNELEILSFMISGNILDILELHPSSKGTIANIDIPKYNKQRIKIFGWPIAIRPHFIPNRGNMKFITMEDKTETADVVLWPEVYKKFKEITYRQGPYEIYGTVKEEHGCFSIFADSIKDIEWSPAEVDFDLASKKLRNSYNNEYIYKEIKQRKTGAA